LNSDYAGHRLTFQLFAQSPPFAHLGAVYRNFGGVALGVIPGEASAASRGKGIQKPREERWIPFPSRSPGALGRE
jgi:hypothetical protein